MRMLLKGLEPHQIYIVQLRTVLGERKSDYSRSFELHTLKDEIAPNPVTSLSAVFNEGNLSIAWVPPTHSSDGSELTDLKDYRVTIGPSPADPILLPKEFFVDSNRFEFTKEMNTALFTTYKTSLVITVQARDLVGNLSTFTPLVKAKPRPSAPTGLAWNSVGNAFAGTWVAPTTNVDGSQFTDLDGYDVTVVYAVNSRKTYRVPVAKFDFSYEQNKADFGGVNQTAKTPLTLEVRARDSVGQLSDPISLEAGNAIPLKVTGVTGTAITDGVVVKWTPTADTDLVAYEIWSTNTPTGAGTLFGRVSAADREYIHQTVAYSQDHYLYVVAVDEFGSKSPDSDRTGPHRPKSPFTVDTTAPGASTLTTGTPARAVTEQAAVTLTWTKPADSDLAGYQIRYSENVTPRVWEYVDVADKDATTTTIQGLRSSSIYYFQLRPYDSMINTNAWPAEVAGTSSKSTIAPVELVSDIKVISGGTLRSNDYVSGGTTGWLLQSSGLEILGGLVNARVIKAGELRSNVNVATGLPDAGQPLWSLNLDGNLTVRNAAVKGKIVVGNAAAGGTANDVSIASANYGGTGSQWAIKGDGTIDLKSGGTGANSLQIRSDGILGYDGGGNLRIHMNTSGQFTMATTNGGVRFDDNGIYGYSGATNTFYINRNGAAYFSGEVRAGSGAIGGWNLAGNNLYSGNLNLRSDLGMIYGGDLGNRVAMRAGEGFWAGADAWGNAPFRVTTTGALYSFSGQIGGFNIYDAGLWSGSASTRVQMQGGYGFWAGADSRDSAPFHVNQDGHLHARNSHIEGNIYAYGGDLHNLTVRGTLSGGTISGSTITGGRFQTDGGSYNRVVIGPDANAYTGATHGIAWGGRGWAKMGTNYEFELGNYDGLNLTIMRLNANGSYTFQSADSSSGYGLAHGLGIYSQGPYLYDKAIWMRGPGDTNHRIQYAGGLGDGVQVYGFSHFGVTIVQYSSSANAMRLDNGARLYVGGSGNFNQSTIKNKKNVKTMTRADGIAKVKKMRPVFYDRTDIEDVGISGVIAEEVVEYAPELVMMDEVTGEPLAVNYAGFTPYLMKAIQELSDEVDALKAQLAKKPAA